MRNPLAHLHYRIGIDLGTSRTRIWHSRAELVVDEATCLAVDKNSQRVIAVGDEAAAMKGRVGADVQIVEPVVRGEIAEPAYVKALLQVLLQRVYTSFTFFRPTVMVSVPAAAQRPLRDLTTEVMYQVGAQEVFTISQPLAGAIGAGVPIADASGTFIVQLGHGVIEAAVISLGSIVKLQQSPLAGAWWELVIQQAVAEQQRLQISPSTARELQQQVVTVGDSATRSAVSHLTSGQSLETHSPAEMTLTTADLVSATEWLLEEYQTLVTHLIAEVPPELTGDIIDKGMLLSGGLAQLTGLDDYLVQNLGVPVSVVDEPDRAVIRGIATALENLEAFDQSLGYRI